MLFNIYKTSKISEITIDTSENVIENYKIIANKLVKFPYQFEIKSWNKVDRISRMKKLNDLVAKGGSLVIAKNFEGEVIGIASLNSKVYSHNRLQLYSLHVDRSY